MAIDSASKVDKPVVETYKITHVTLISGLRSVSSKCVLHCYICNAHLMTDNLSGSKVLYQTITTSQILYLINYNIEIRL